METSEFEHPEGKIQGGREMEPRVTPGHQDESGFSLIPGTKTCGSKAKQGGLLEAWHRYMVREDAKPNQLSPFASGSLALL